MAKARKNPLGIYLPGVIPVIVGQGKFVHIYHPTEHVHLCRSGKNAGKPPASGAPDLRGTREQIYYRSQAKNITCWRCCKLGYMNLREGRPAWKGRFSG